MPGRSRSQTYPRVSGKFAFNSAGPFDPTLTQVNSDSGTCVDVTGHGEDCEPFDLNRRSTTGGYVNRPYGGGSTDYWFNNYICDYLRIGAPGDHMSLPDFPSQAYRCTEAVKRTNPSRPYVDVPVSVLDMRRGLQSIRDAGHSIRDAIRHGGSHVLNYEFMIKPLVGDLVKMRNAQREISNRIKVINRLYEGKGYRRTVSHGGWSRISHDPSVTVQSVGSTLHSAVTRITRATARTHVRWAAQEKCGVRPAPEQVRMWATRAVLGGTIDFSTLWELVPWSWLIDWFGNVGDYLIASRNIIPARLIGVYPMVHTQTQTTGTGDVHTSFSGRKTILEPWSILRVRKTRSIGAASITAHFPFLDRRQVGILASLAATRR